MSNGQQWTDEYLQFAIEQRLQQLHKFLILLEDKNEILTLFLNEEDMKRWKHAKVKLMVLFYLDLFNVC